MDHRVDVDGPMASADGRFTYMDRDGEPLPDDTPLGQVGRLGFRCRSQRHSHCSLNIKGGGYDVPQRNWVLSGTADRPTVSPSVNCDGCWHGYIEDGVFKTASKEPEAEQ